MEHTEENLQENLQQDSSENLDNNIIPESLSEELVTENTQDSKEQKEPCRIINFPDQDRLGNLLLTIVESLILEKDQLQIVKCKPEDLEPELADIQTYRVGVSDEDMGRVIGKNGKTARSIRSVMRSAAIKNGLKVDVRIGPHFDPEKPAENYEVPVHTPEYNNYNYTRAR